MLINIRNGYCSFGTKKEKGYSIYRSIQINYRSVWNWKISKSKIPFIILLKIHWQAKGFYLRKYWSEMDWQKNKKRPRNNLRYSSFLKSEFKSLKRNNEHNGFRIDKLRIKYIFGWTKSICSCWRCDLNEEPQI